MALTTVSTTVLYYDVTLRLNVLMIFPHDYFQRLRFSTTAECARVINACMIIIIHKSVYQYNTIQYSLLNSSNKRACSDRFVNVTIVSSK